MSRSQTTSQEWALKAKLEAEKLHPDNAARALAFFIGAMGISIAPTGDEEGRASVCLPGVFPHTRRSLKGTRR